MAKVPATYESRALTSANYQLLDDHLSDSEPLAGTRLLRMVWIVMAVTIAAIFGWTALAPLNKGVNATGAVSTQSARQVIQHLDGGIIRTLNVKEGERVKAGQVLVVIDDALAKAQYNVVRQQYFDHLGERAMLEADISGAPLVWPKELLDNQADPAVKSVMMAESKVLADRRGGRAAQKAVLSQQVASLGDQVTGLNAQTQSIQSQDKLIGEEAKGVEGLYKQGFAPKTRLLELQRNQANLQGSLGSAQAQISQAHTMMGEKRMQAVQIDAQSRQESSKRLSDVITETLQLQEKMADQAQVLARTVIKSPVDGIVLERHIATVGGVIKPGEPVLDIVPTAELEVTGKLRPNDVENIKVGQKAHIKFSGLNVQTTPQLDATVSYVSADALADQKTGQRYYEVRATVTPAERKKLGDQVLTPGMPAEIMVDGGARTMLQYLIQPVEAAFSHAFREG